MNNAAYLDLVDDAVARLAAAEGWRPVNRYRVSHVRPALPGAAIEVACWPVYDDSVGLPHH